jgi:hypothetical protein
MRFQLLQGVHQDDRGNTYRVETVKDSQGKVTGIRQPIITTKSDLVARFGAEKFRRLPDLDEVNQAPEEPEVPAPPPAPSVPVLRAGRRANKRFPGAAAAGLDVYVQADGSYNLYPQDNEAPALVEGLDKDGVKEFVNEYSER